MVVSVSRFTTGIGTSTITMQGESNYNVHVSNQPVLAMRDRVLLYRHEWVRFDQCANTRERISALITCDHTNIHAFAHARETTQAFVPGC